MRLMPKPASPANDRKPKQVVWPQAMIPKERRLCAGLLSIWVRIKPFLKSEGKSGECARKRVSQVPNMQGSKLVVAAPAPRPFPFLLLGQAVWWCWACECREPMGVSGQGSILLPLARCGREPHRSNQLPKGVTLQATVLESPVNEGRGGQGTRGGKGHYCIFF